jgi:hypothetical protein
MSENNGLGSIPSSVIMRPYWKFSRDIFRPNPALSTDKELLEQQSPQLDLEHITRRLFGT